MTRRLRPVRIDAVVYRMLQRALPRDFRRQFGADMQNLFLEQRRQAMRNGTLWRFRASVLADVLRHGIATRMTDRNDRPPSPERERRMTLSAIVNDLRLAVRGLRLRPAFAVPIIMTLALGIGVVTAVAIVVHGVLLRPLDYPAADRMLMVWEQTEHSSTAATSHAMLNDWKQGTSAFAGIAGSHARSTTVTGLERAERASTLFVTADFFVVAGTAVRMGRTFTREESSADGPAAVVVSDRFWREVLGSPTSLDGVVITFADALNRTAPHAVVGVLPPGFNLHQEADLYASLDRAVPWNARNHVLRVTARVRPGIPIEAAVAQLTATHERVRAENPEMGGIGVTTRPLTEHVLGPVRKPLLLLLGAAGLLLATAFVNAAGALLARGIARAPELRLRLALGASRGRIVTQLLAESVVLAAAAATLAVSFAWLLAGAFAQIDAAVMPRLQDVNAGWIPLIGLTTFAAGLGVMTFGLGAAVLSTRGSRDVQLQRTVGRRGERRIWRVLLTMEIAFSFMLLIGAGLLGRSLYNIATEDTGFDPEGVTAIEVVLPSQRYRSDADYVRYLDDALEQLRAEPGVEVAGMSNLLPLPGSGSVSGPVQLEAGVNQEVAAEYRVVNEGFFAALRIPLRSGRMFGSGERPGTPHSVVINESLARQLWGEEDAVGERMLLPDGMDPYRGEWLHVIGVVADARPWTVAAGTQPAFYVDYRQRPGMLSLTGATLLVRSRVSVDAAALNRRLTRIDANVPVRIASLEDRLASSVADRHFVLSVLGSVAALALVLAAAGIWGASTFTVSRRIREMGIRQALGAAPRQVRLTLQAEALVPLVAGITVGGVLALLFTQWLRSLLFGVEPADPLTALAAAATLAAAVWLASYVPAWRTARMNPLTALTTEE